MEKNKNSKYKKIFTVLCILAPVTAIIFILLNNYDVLSISKYLPYGLLLLCPLSHLLMMPLMHKFMSKNNDHETGSNKPECH